MIGWAMGGRVHCKSSARKVIHPSNNFSLKQPNLIVPMGLGLGSSWAEATIIRLKPFQFVHGQIKVELYTPLNCKICHWRGILR